MEIEIKPAKLLYYDFKELYEFRDALFFLTWKDIKIKYKQAALGFFWAILQPALMMSVFIVFRKVIFIWTGETDIPYPLFVLSGILFWNLFSGAITQSSNSIVNHAHIIKKIYFPRIFFPISAVLVSLFDFFMGLLVYIPVMIYYKEYPSFWLIAILPACVILTILVAMGVGSFFSALNVKYRDVKYIIPFAIQLLFFISPVFYSHSFITNKFLLLFYYVNPITGILELIRFGLFGMPINISGLVISCGSVLLSFIIGMLYFRRFETTFADIA
ncbi:MAG: ABC transporter permease [Bacteroidales bacterium]